MVLFVTSTKTAERGSKMDFRDLFDMQEKFDAHVKEKRGLEGVNLYEDKITALEVELSEFANEVKFFKFWSSKPMDREKALFEYVDALHFFLSVGNELQVTYTHDYPMESITDIKQIYRHLKIWIFQMSGPMQWHIAFGMFRALGKAVGFSEDEIRRAYLEKHKENYARQAAGY